MRRKQSNRAVHGEGDDHYLTVANPSKGEKHGERRLNKRAWRRGGKSQKRHQGEEKGAEVMK
jgi:hypothetical protein